MSSSNNFNYSQLLHQTGDIVSIFGASLLAFYLRNKHFQVEDDYWILTFIACIFSIAFSTHREIYLPHQGFRSKFYSDIIANWITTGVFVIFYLVFTKQSEVYSRLWLGLWGASALSLGLIAHTLILLLDSRITRQSSRPICVIGNSKTIHKIQTNLVDIHFHNFKIETTIDLDETDDPVSAIQSCGNSQEIWISLPLEKGDLIKDLTYQLKNETRDIRFIPELSDLLLLNHKVEQIADLSVINLSCSPLQGTNSYIKRFEDIVLSIFFLLIFLPIMILISICIKLTSPGPIIFKQKRHGLNGKEITVYKFRSMMAHEDSKLITQAKKGDARVTRIGAIIRKTSMDELPQFINVLQGTMSIVGPRPHALSHNNHYKEIIESYMRRHKVKPGITGWAQANGFRGETDTIDKMEKRVEHDLYYIDNWSLIFDLKIITMTAYRLVFDKMNAY